jgi:predicted acyltransferase
MPDANPKPNPKPDPNRIRSIDVLRGLTILVMLFVNDVAGVADAPAWMKHVFPSTADGMTFVDVVFPAFLFIVGLSLPLALERRLGKGRLSAAGHILTRTLALLVIGVFMVNTENISGKGPLNPGIWQLLLYAALCLVWISPSKDRRILVWIRRAAGAAMLIVLVFLYRGEPDLVPLRTQWWGILGLIGWAYLVTSLLYLALRKDALGFAAGVSLLYCVFAADAAGFFGFLGSFNNFISIGSMLGSHAAVTASGALLGIVLFQPGRTHGSRIGSILKFAGVLAAAAVLLHSLNGVHRIFIYNKNAATPPWCLLSSAWTALIFAVLYFLVDVKGLGFGTRMIASAGQNALFAFILGPIAYILIGWLPLSIGGKHFYWGWLGGFPAGLFRSLVFAVLATALTAWLQRRGRALRL